MKVARYLRNVCLLSWSASRILMICLFLCINPALAGTHTLTVKVKVVEMSCDIYGDDGLGQSINVDMGDIIIKKIDGISYKRTNIPYFLKCDDSDDNPALRLKFDGPSMSGQEANVLSTSDDNLGLRLLANNSNLNLGVWYKFNYSTKPELSVIPINSGTGGINDGKMSASVTLSVEYQ